MNRSEKRVLVGMSGTIYTTAHAYQYSLFRSIHFGRFILLAYKNT